MRIAPKRCSSSVKMYCRLKTQKLESILSVRIESVTGLQGKLVQSLLSSFCLVRKLYYCINTGAARYYCHVLTKTKAVY